MVFEHCKWHFRTNWDKLEKSRADVFKFTRMQSVSIFSNFAHPYPFLAFLWFFWVLLQFKEVIVSCSWSVPKLPKYVWHSPFKVKAKIHPSLSYYIYKVYSQEKNQFFWLMPIVYTWCDKLQNSLPCFFINASLYVYFFSYSFNVALVWWK